MYISQNDMLSSFVFFEALCKGYNTVHGPVKLAFLIQHFFLHHSYGCYFSFLLLHSIPLSEHSVTKLSILCQWVFVLFQCFFFFFFPAENSAVMA